MAQKIRDGLMKSLCWQVAERDDTKIVKALVEGEEVDGVYAIEEMSLLDEFFYFLQEHEILRSLESLAPWEIERQMVSFDFFVLLYWLKTLMGIETMNSLPELLFSDEKWMKWIGFNARQIENGICDRGKFRRSEDNDRPGPICVNTLADNIEKIPIADLEAFYNKSIREFARMGCFGKRVSLIEDTTDYVTTDKYEGCGQVTREKQVKNKEGKYEKIEVTVYGWKLGAVFHAESRIPVALKIDKINAPDNSFTRDLINQAIKNLEGITIEQLTIDRGFLDGEDLFWLDSLGIKFVIPAKKDMDVYGDAKSLAERYAHDIHCPEIVVKSREVKKTKGSGKNSRQEALVTELVGVPNLLSYSQYCSAVDRDKMFRKDFKPNPISAVVVLKWENKEFPRDKWKVFLTNKPVKDPFEAFDSYDGRSFIENSLFREWKQKWYLLHPAKKTEKAVTIHVFLTAVAMATTWAFRNWKRRQDEIMERGKVVGIEVYRRRLKAENRDKVIIFLGNIYGILHVQEMAILLGVKIKEPSKNVGLREEILRKYGMEVP